jgi:RNA recognition motif-containing protein
MTDSARWKATVYVGGLSPLATTSHVHDAFLPFGEIVEVKVPKADAPNSAEPHRGFAYVEFEDVADAKEAIDNMDQSEFFGKTIKVSQAKAPKSADEGLGSKKAIWEQVCADLRFTCRTVANTKYNSQESWIAKHAAEDKDESALEGAADAGPDPMQGLEGLDVAGPRPE